MQKNSAGQKIGAALVATADGAAVTTGTTTVYITLDGGTQSTGSTAVHEGQGQWTYAPSQAETNGDHCQFLFVNSSAVLANIQVYTRQDVNLIEIAGTVQDATDLGDFAAAGYDPATNKVQGVVLVDTATTLTNKTGFSLAATGADLILQGATFALAMASAVWEKLIASHSGVSGSTAEALAAAGSAGDPWITALPGAYSAGQAGNIIGNMNDFDPAVDDVTLADGAHGGTAAVLTLERMVAASTTTDEPAMKLTGNGAGAGLTCVSATTGHGIDAVGGSTSGSGISAKSRGGNKPGVVLTGVGSGSGLEGQGGTSGGSGARFLGGATSGAGLRAVAQGGNSVGFDCFGNGSGKDIDAAEIDDIKTDTGNLVSRITSGLFTGITSLAEWLGSLAGLQTPDATAQSEMRLTGAGSGAYDATTDSQEAIAGAGGGGAPTADQNAVAVWDKLQSAHTTAGTFGVLASEIASILADTGELQTNQGNWITATGFSTHSAADVWAVATRELTANTNLNDPTIAQIVAGVWDEATAGNITAGTFGAQLKTVLDIVAADTTTDLPALIATLQAAMDTVTKAGPTKAEMDTAHGLLATSSVLGTPAGSSIAADIAENQVDLNAVLARLLTMQVSKNAVYSSFMFLMVLASDGKTPATGLTVTGQRSIDGGAFASVSGVIAEISNGIYQFDALAADTNGDRIMWRFSAGTADDAFIEFNTVS